MARSHRGKRGERASLTIRGNKEVGKGEKKGGEVRVLLGPREERDDP